ncbi:MAG TPA: Hsp70 family protein, partial [Stellaceae bacterium]|nr:Hsp70 family protein [Stellaceae bacterium]
FDIDANGIVSVSAKDKATGQEKQIRVQASGGLSQADIEKMVKDAEAHAEEDKKRRELVDTKNHAESAIHMAEKALKDAGEKVPAAERQTVEAAVADLKTVTSGDDVNAIKAKTQTLLQAAQRIGEAMYKAESAAGPQPGAGPQGGPQPGQGKPAGEDKVVDADFEEVDEKKRGQA